MQSKDLEKLRRLIPMVEYVEFLKMDVNNINLQLGILKDLSNRKNHRYPLTAAQKYTIANQVHIVTNSS